MTMPRRCKKGQGLSCAAAASEHLRGLSLAGMIGSGSMDAPLRRRTSLTARRLIDLSHPPRRPAHMARRHPLHVPIALNSHSRPSGQDCLLHRFDPRRPGQCCDRRRRSCLVRLASPVVPYLPTVTLARNDHPACCPRRAIDQHRLPLIDPRQARTLLASGAACAAGLRILEGLVLNDGEPGDYELIALPICLGGCDAVPVRAVLRSLV